MIAKHIRFLYYDYLKSKIKFEVRNGILGYYLFGYAFWDTMYNQDTDFVKFMKKYIIK